MDPEIFEIMALAASAAGFIVAIMLGKALARRIGGPRGSDSAVTEEVAALRHRVASLEADLEHIGELEERVDFAERMLAEVRDPAKAIPRDAESLTGERTDP